MKAIGRWLYPFGPPLLVATLYVGGVCLIAWGVIQPRQVGSKYADAGTVAYLAARRLPANTRLRPEHLIPPRDLPPGYFWYLPKPQELHGKYLRYPVKAEVPVTPALVRGWPELPTPATGRAMAFALKDQLSAEFLNAGALVDVCPGTGDCAARGKKVEAVVCGTESTPACHAVVVLSDTEVAAVLKAPRQQLLLTAFP